MRLYAVYERQSAEEAIVNEHLYPKTGKPRELPAPARMRQLVDDKIAAKRTDEAVTNGGR